jgi:hypothetical protein
MSLERIFNMIPEITVCGMLFHLYYKSCRRAAILAIFLVFVGHGGSTKANDERNDVNVSIVNLSCIYNNSNTCIQSTYLSDYTVLQSLRFLSGFW